MRAFSIFCSVAVLMISGLASGAGANHYAADERLRLPAKAPELPEARPAMAPIAYIRFCLTNEGQCRVDSGLAVLTLTADVWRQLQEVNNAINARISPDASKGAFDWSVQTTLGNCNDYAVQKQKALLNLGFPKPALSLTSALTERGLGHLVVTVRTDRGDFVLDNLRPAILPWNRTGYRWLMRQSVSDPRQWVSISTGTVYQTTANLWSGRRLRTSASQAP